MINLVYCLSAPNVAYKAYILFDGNEGEGEPFLLIEKLPSRYISPILKLDLNSGNTLLVNAASSHMSDAIMHISPTISNYPPRENV